VDNQETQKDKDSMEVTIEYIRNLKKLYGPKVAAADTKSKIKSNSGTYGNYLKKSESMTHSRGNLASKRMTIGF
jgi:hypothetical protein